MNDYIHLKTPHDLASVDLNQVLLQHLRHPAAAEAYLNATTHYNYLYWDKARYVDPIPNLSTTESWVLTRAIREFSSIATPIHTPDGHTFTWFRPKYTDRFLRQIDMCAGGMFLTEKFPAGQAKERQRYLMRGIVEEAIASSQLEGADTSRRYARKMIAEHIKPRNKSEQMILNNYQVMQKIENQYKDQPLSLFMLRELQAHLTHQATSGQFTPGELRQDSDDIVIYYNNRIAHTPPPHNFVQQESDRLITYANNDDEFIHPVIKAIILHFWIGYLHPFPDGNGRLARAIFYWYLLKNGYWAITYLPISTVIKRAPSDYTYSYIYSEQDNYDFTYFFDYNIKRIIKTIEEFQAYINRKSTENTTTLQQLRLSYPALNTRQEQALLHLTKTSNAFTTPNAYATLNGITLRTAYKDLKNLEQTNLIIKKQVNRRNYYYPTDKLKKIL